MSCLRTVVAALIVMWVGRTVPAAQSQAIAFEHVNLISMNRLPTSAVDVDSSVLVQNGVIVGIGSWIPKSEIDRRLGGLRRQ